MKSILHSIQKFILITSFAIFIFTDCYTQTQSPVLEHFTSTGTGNDWTLVTGQPNCGAHVSDLCANITGNYIDNEYYSWESPLLDFNLWADVEVTFSVAQNIRKNDELYLYYYDSFDNQWYGWDISDLNGVYVVSAPVTARLFSIDFNTNTNGNINGKYFHIDYLNITDPFIPLPIELLSFGAETNDVEEVVVEWSTASQSNNDYFTIQRSDDGYEWLDLTKINGCGSCNNEIDYTYLDWNPYTGLSYYRLMQTDYDGVFEIFDAVSVNVNSNNTIGLHITPNPAIDNIQLELVYPDPLHRDYNHDVRIYNSDGVEVYKKFYIGELEDFNIDIKKLKPGYYIVNTKSNRINGVGKFIKE